MKYFWLFLLLLIAGFGALLMVSKPAQVQAKNMLYASPCDSPIHYRIGTVDSRFDITREALQSDIDQADTIWSKVYGKNLFVYDPNAGLSINLVYDGRQSLTNKVSQLEGELDTNKTNLKSQIDSYKQQSQDFQQRLKELNQEIDYWNSQGGAPADEYDKLNVEQSQLRDEAQQLNQIAQRLNLTTDQYNNQVNQLNQTINTFNQALTKKPEEGLYNPQKNTIDIYFDSSQAELVHTLTHEMGHALGMNHVQDPRAIMNPYTNTYIIPTKDDIAELHTVCQKQDRFEMMGKDLIIWLHTLLMQYGIQ
jgi:chaperonin cofactor prefoldin